MKYLTIRIRAREGGGYTVQTRLSKRRWDEPCECEDDSFEGEDIHDDVWTTMHVEDMQFSVSKALNIVKVVE